MFDTPRQLIVIVGPTGVGKTDLALWLAQTLKTDIISADSRQCYREMSIGTAKPSPKELALVKHLFIDSHSVQQEVTAFDFEQYALHHLEHLFQYHQQVILCGGTGLYVKALCEGLDEMPKVLPKHHQEVAAGYQEGGLEWLQEKLKKEDPLFYQKGEIQNPARIMRALAFYRSVGKSILHFQSHQPKERYFKSLKIGLELPRPLLYERINLRVEQMMAQGLLEEVSSLLPYSDLKALKTVGYSELFAYLEGHLSFEKAVSKIKQHSRNYAKRQLTWFKKDSDINWFDPRDREAIERHLFTNIP